MATTRPRHAAAFLEAALPLAQVYRPGLTVEALSQAEAQRVVRELDQGDTLLPVFQHKTIDVWSAVAAAPQDRATVLDAAEAAKALQGELTAWLAQTGHAPTVDLDSPGWAEQTRTGFDRQDAYVSLREDGAREAVAGYAERDELMTAMTRSAQSPELVAAIEGERATDQAALREISQTMTAGNPSSRTEAQEAATFTEAVRITAKWTGLDSTIESLAARVDEVLAEDPARIAPTIQSAMTSAEETASLSFQYGTMEEARAALEATSTEILTGQRILQPDVVRADSSQLQSALEAAQTEGRAHWASWSQTFTSVEQAPPSRVDEYTTAAVVDHGARMTPDAREQESAEALIDDPGISRNRPEIAEALIDRYAPLLGESAGPLRESVRIHDIDSLAPRTEKIDSTLIRTPDQFENALRGDLEPLMSGHIGPTVRELLEQHDNVAARLDPSFSPKPFPVALDSEKLTAESPRLKSPMAL